MIFMDEDQSGVKETEVQPEIESPAIEETPTTTEPEPEEVNSTEETETVDETEVKESGKTANARIRELNAKLKEETVKAQSFAERLAELTGSVEPEAQPQYTPQVEPGSEITTEQYKADVARAADAIVQLRLKQQQYLDRIDREAKEAVEIYPELKPGTDKFDEDLSNSVYEATEAYVRANPAKSVKAFVDSMMKPYKKSLIAAKGQVEENMAKQVSKTALRPTQVKAEEKPFEKLSVREMEAKLGVTQV